MNFELIEPEHVHIAWPHMRRFIERSQQRGPTDMTSDEMARKCQRDPTWRLVMMGELDGAAIIRIVGDHLHVAAIGGDFPQGWHLEFFEWLAAGGRANGLGYITLAGRKGWLRKLRGLGFKQLDGLHLGAAIP